MEFIQTCRNPLCVITAFENFGIFASQSELEISNFTFKKRCCKVKYLLREKQHAFVSKQHLRTSVNFYS